ncbi:MAG: MptD family putative ECF transporter S component [Eubacteriales bacterium]|nr:MptD family putative ECF transporter S component [Eubacteriales bacterium]
MQSKLKSKDIITVTLLSLCNILIFSIGTFMYATPITVLLTPVVYSLLQGIVFYVIGVKVKKRGAYFIYSVIQGAIGFYLPYVLMFVISGLIAELLLSKKGYGNLSVIGISYVIQQTMASIGSVIYPYAFALERTTYMVKEQNVVKNVSAAGKMIASWGSLVLLLLVIVSAAIGAYIGKKVVQKHILEKQFHEAATA